MQTFDMSAMPIRSSLHSKGKYGATLNEAMLAAKHISIDNVAKMLMMLIMFCKTVEWLFRMLPNCPPFENILIYIIF